MTFISYAQNFEDVMLWRALKHIVCGFYIDVGANAPGEDSVTRAFYDKGWSGINIEPITKHHSELQKDRPRDINLCCAAGASAGNTRIWQCDVRGWASIDEETIRSHEANGILGSISDVPMETLSRICSQHAPAEIHFLKIDVEGFEQAVLEGMDFQKYRPWIVLVEAARPNTTEENHREWEPLLTSNSYDFVYADGINRFYLAREHSSLTPAFRYPPNFLDGFHAAKYEEIHRVAQAAQAQARMASSQLQLLEARVLHAENACRQAEAQAKKAEIRHHQAAATAATTDLALQRMEQRAIRAELGLREGSAPAEALRILYLLRKCFSTPRTPPIRGFSPNQRTVTNRGRLWVKLKHRADRVSQKFDRLVNGNKQFGRIIRLIRDASKIFRKSRPGTSTVNPALLCLTPRELVIYRQLVIHHKGPAKGDA
jgi:FkbM family methyltransferase